MEQGRLLDLLQVRVLRFGLLKDGDVGVGFSPQGFSIRVISYFASCRSTTSES